MASFTKSAFAIPTLTVLIVLLFSGSATGQTFTLNPIPGGIPGTVVGSNYQTTFGTMNALAIGTPETGLTASALSNGALYFTEAQVTFSGLPGPHLASLTVYVSSQFSHPSAQIMEGCPSTSSCSSPAGYSVMSSSAAAPSTLIASMGNTTATVGIGIMLPDNDGASTFTGTDGSGVVTITMTDLTNHHVTTDTVSFNYAPANQVQDAVELTVSTATGGLMVSTGAGTDYSMSFGSVNGLGIGATLPTVAAAGGIIYSTPYYLNPVFTDFASTTSSIKACVSTNFAHPTILKLDDSAVSTGPYNAISTSCAAPTLFTTTAADRSIITRYLGLFVSLDNAATPYLGNDDAIVTFTMTVP